MKHRLNFVFLLGFVVAAPFVLAQTPPRMALPTGGLNPPAMNAPQPAKSLPAKAATPVLIAAQPVISATPISKPTAPATTAFPTAAPAAADAANPFNLAPAAAAPSALTPPTLPAPVFQFVQKPILPPTVSGPPTRYDRTAQPNPEQSRVPNRIRDCLLKASDEVQLPAQEAGVLVELLAKEGLEVLKNQPLGRVDDSQPRLQKKAAEAERMVSAEKGKSTINERYSLKAADVSKQKWLKSEKSNVDAPGSVSQIEIMENKLLYEKALLEYERAQEERKIETLTTAAKDVDVEAAEDSIRRRQLVAPINGTIVEITPHVGEWLKPGDPVLKIVNMEILKIEGFVNIEHIRPDKLRNRTVDAYVDVGEKLPLKVNAIITFVSPVVEAGGDYRIKAEIVNGKNPQTGDWYLKPGENAELVLNDEPAK
jgi:macrolide-specific efflux system membrane fusion protein